MPFEIPLVCCRSSWHAGPDFRRIFFELFEFDGQHGKPLVDVIVKFSRNPGAFLLLSLNQLSGHAQKRFFCPLSLGDIHIDAEHS